MMIACYEHQQTKKHVEQHDYHQLFSKKFKNNLWQIFQNDYNHHELRVNG